MSPAPFCRTSCWAEFTAASSVSQHVRQSSPIADSGLESVMLSLESLSDLDLSISWMASSSLICTTLSLSQSPILPESSTMTMSLEFSVTLSWTGGLMSLNAGWLGLWLVADNVLLHWVLGWTLLLDPGWTDGRLCPLLKLPCFGMRSHLSLSTSLMSMRGSCSPSHLLTGGADLVLTLEPWLPLLMGFILILMQALFSHWSLIHCQRNDHAFWIGCQ